MIDLDYRETCRAIEREARERAAQQMVPEPGEYVAWSSTTVCGITSDSKKNGAWTLHRVGTPIRGHQYTVCREVIPDVLLLLPLYPAMIRTMAKCGFCEAGYAKTVEES